MPDKPELDASKSCIKVWCDGCYDLVHFGHANSLRQAKALGDFLVVGVHSDEEIAKHKGPPVFSLEERCRMLSAIRWVDQVVPAAPYTTDLETLDLHGCAFCCHGDDVTLTDDGRDSYRAVKAAGRYREVQRTKGISTTGLVERILAAGQLHREAPRSPWSGLGELLLSSRTIAEFARLRPRRADDRVVYLAGGFDLFHLGHLQLLEKARQLGTYLVVGLYSDGVIARYKGARFPIMGVHERLLSLLACKYVSEVVIDVPVVVTRDLMECLKIDMVVGGVDEIDTNQDLYECPKQLHKFFQIDSDNDVTTDKIIERIVRNKSQYLERNEKKEKKEMDLISEMQRV